MGQFINTIMFPGVVGNDTNGWKHYFEQYDEDQWELIQGGLVQYLEDSITFKLLVEHRPSLGFLLQHSCKKRAERGYVWSLYSLFDKAKLSEFSELDEIYLPVGCFLPPNLAWKAVEDFLASPKVPSIRIDWIKGDDIEWPEL